MPQQISIVENMMGANDRLALQNRARLDDYRIFAINVMASPGAGKTSLILRTIEALKDVCRIGVIEGDTAPVTIDAEKIQSAGIPAVQINTGGGCHLDAVMVQEGFAGLELEELNLLIVENVGNLICPAAFQIGTHANILVASVPEGDDKPYKYPGIYRGLQALVLNKIDLLPYVTFDIDYFRQGVEVLNPGLAFFPLSCTTGDGFEIWLTWLRQQLDKSR
ncbi:MAG: hydrogenase nickel incorporation protein HypB [Anaerolineales bacterium]|nr:hydrogenase nickel incorporation protein HypB [Anaerolineales bacterium]